MKLCEYSHPEICHAELNCPICEVIADKDKEIEELKDSLRKSEATITDKDTELRQLQDEIRQFEST